MLLQSVQNTSHQFCLLQLEQAHGLAEICKINLGEAGQKDLITDLYSRMMAVLSPSVSGVIVSPEYSFSSIQKKDSHTGLLINLEKSVDSVDPMSLPPLIPNWGVEHIRNNYALAKLELYYHPNEHEAIRKKQLVAELYEYCQLLDIDFLLELKLFPPQENLDNISSMREAQVMAIEDFRNQCSIIALEFPGDTLSAVTITAELDIPWLMTSGIYKFVDGGHANDYEQFKENLRIALDSGARGFMAGNLIWKDIFEKMTEEKWRDEFPELLVTKVRDRVIELCRITNEANPKVLD